MKRINGKILHHPYIWILCFFLAIPVNIIGFCSVVNLGSFAGAFLLGFENVSAFFLQYTVLLLFCVLLYSLTSRLWISYTLCSGICFVFTLINHYKMVINGSPLVLQDLTLAPRFSDILTFALPQLELSIYIIAPIVGILITVCFLFLADRHIRLKYPARLILCGAGVLLTAGLLFTPILPLWANSDERIPVSDADWVCTYGVPVGLYLRYVQKKEEPSVHTPVAFDALRAQTASVLDERKDVSVKPHVIFLMSESFFDVQKLPGVTFSEDPIANYHALAEKYTSGEFISSTYCGGTGYVEMEVLTGLCGNLLRESETLTSLSPITVYERIPTIADIFDSYGYRTSFLHSYNSNLYNRETIYTAFGFDDILFDDSFPADAERKGGYISDMALSEKIISMYEERGDEPMFIFALSMENHQPYTAEKFDHKPIRAESDLLSEDELSVLTGYVNGLYDADRALQRLVAFFSAQDEPAMIVFFGDHLPSLSNGDGKNVYASLGYSSTSVTTDWEPSELQKMLSTNYLIWSNYEEEAKPDTLQSCNMLGISVLNRLGFSLGSYYGWLDSAVAPYMLIYRPRLYVDVYGNAFSEIPQEHRGIMENYRLAVYDIVYGDGSVFNISRGQEKS